MPHTVEKRERQGIILIGFLALTLGGGFLLGWLFGPGTWYQALEKPTFTPPSWVFPTVWTPLYILIAIVGWRIWRAQIPGAMGLWWMQLVLNFAWSPVHFGLHRIGLALFILVLLFVVVLWLLMRLRSEDRLSMGLLLPYTLWLAFAGILNWEIFRLNS